MSRTTFRTIVRHTVTDRFDIDMTLRSEARITALFGPSGAGKSTVLKLVAGWIRSETAVFVEGERLDRNTAGAEVPLNRRNIGMVFQNDLLFPHLSAAENATFARRYLPESRPLDVAGFMGLVERFGAAHLMDKPVRALSGGERQRIGLIRALASRPKLLLCDEPVGAIDRTSRFRLLEQLKDHVEADGIVMLLITHDPEEVVRTAGHMWHIDAGRLLEEGPPGRFFGEFRRPG